ncbi:hypothetical protein MYX07_04540 [Patescibacteria group bacterium AH-259-L07]|nr:hypothetical protein [Patescibacteria group bacterium AH-259-L07]
MSPDEKKILFFIQENGDENGEVSQGKICRQFNISGGYRDLVLNPLKAKGIVKKRHIMWSLTKKGEDSLAIYKK